MDHEEAFFDVADDHDAGLEVGVVAPGAIELGGIRSGVDIEKGGLFELPLRHIGEVEDLQARAVVGLVGISLVGVEVVVNGWRGAHMGPDEGGVVQVLHVEDVGAGVDGPLVQLVADKQEFVVFGQPALVGVGRGGIALGADEVGVARIGHVHDGDGVLVEAEGNLLAAILGIRPDVVDDLGVVGITVLGEAADQGGVQGVVEVEDVEAARKGVGPDDITPSGGRVDGDVVGAAEAAEVGVRIKRGRRVGDVPELGQVKDLHAVSGGFRHDEGVVVKHLDVAPQGRDRVGGQVAEVNRVDGVRHVDEGRAGRASQQGVLLAVERVGPSPDVVHFPASDGIGIQLGKQVHLVTGVNAGKPIHARRLGQKGGAAQGQ